MSDITYESLPYDELTMEKALKEYDQEQGLSAFAIATKYDLPVQEIHSEYAKYRLRGNQNETI